MSFVKTRLKNVYEDPDTGVYYVRIRRKGKRPFNKSLDTKNFKVASQLADELIREYLGHAPKRREHRLFKDEAKAFLEKYETEVKPGTFMRTASVIRLYLMPYWQNRIITEITAAEWAEYIKHENKRRKRNLSNDKKAMSNILHFAMNEKRIDGVPKLTDPSEPSDVGREVEAEEVDRLLAAAQDNSPLVYTAVLIAYTAGCRIGEIVSIPWKGVKTKDKHMTVNGKTGPRLVAIGQGLADHLEHRKSAANSPWLFPMRSDPQAHMSTNLLDKDWQTVKVTAGVKCRFHDLRHTYITRALRAGHSITKVSKQVGSSVPTITKVYEHLNIKDLADLGEVVSVPAFKGFSGVETV